MIARITFIFITAFLCGCQQNTDKKGTQNHTAATRKTETDTSASCSPKSSNNMADGHNTFYKADTGALSENLKPIDPDLPVIGILLFDKVLTTELTAPMDVFTKPDREGEPLFNVIIIAESYKAYVSEEGLKMFPDYILSNAPELDIIIVPSAYEMEAQVENREIVRFIKQQNENTDYTMSNCAGAHLIGASGIADGKKIVTYIGGGGHLQENYPELKVQDDSKISYVEDGKFLSSNGNLASYISALELLEKMAGKDQRAYVESHLYLDRLQNWKK